VAYHSLEAALLDLEKAGMLRRISETVSPDLEMAEMARIAYAEGMPALLFESVQGSPFRAVCNIFGTEERARFLFRKTERAAATAIQAKADPLSLGKEPSRIFSLPQIGLNALPRRAFSAPVLRNKTRLSDLPQIKSWPEDGGAFLTLPQVFSMDPETPTVLKSNLGMYRVQISGNGYQINEECGLHYQINRDIAAHHQKAIERGEPLKVSIFLGGPPAHTLAAVMPMPENISELVFAGILAGRAFRYTKFDGWVVSADADFCILGEIAPGLKPEGPFGDHLGYYSAKHLFPYLKVKHVFHKTNAVYPFTVVGRPPQEDTVFGKWIHSMTRPMVPVSVAGLCEMHAVDAAGVHPLLLAIGNERYLPYGAREPLEILKIASAILGFNQASLAKFLLIAACEDNEKLSAYSVVDFFKHILERVQFSRDLHFQTATTIDTLDYSGTSLNHGSKVVIAAAGKPCRELGNHFPDFAAGFSLPEGFSNPLQVMPGVLSVQGVPGASMKELSNALSRWEHRERFPWITVCDDSAFTARTLDNWLWVSFTRADPARDIYGVAAQIKDKHFGCEAPLLLDSRTKPYLQKPLTEDPKITERAKQILKRALS
jgi:4-hydroxy-3-polyprenylbenzoate decarboxylase